MVHQSARVGAVDLILAAKKMAWIGCAHGLDGGPQGSEGRDGQDIKKRIDDGGGPRWQGVIVVGVNQQQVAADYRLMGVPIQSSDPVIVSFSVAPKTHFLGPPRSFRVIKLCPEPGVEVGDF